MIPRPLRIGIVGAGANTRARHVPGFRALPAVELVAVANRTPESSARAAAELGIPRAAAHWREIVESPDIDAVCIGAWPCLHAPVTLAALAAGKHVLTEARLAATAVEAETMLAASRAAPGLVAQVVPSPLTLAWDRTVRELLRSGALSATREVALVHTHGAYSDPAAPIAWRQRAEWNGVNTLTLGIYYEVVLRWLDLDAEVTEARAGLLTPTRPDAEGRPTRVDVPDWVRLRAKLPGGATLHAEFSGVETRRPRNEIRIAGERATLRLDLAAGRLWLASHGDGEREILVPPERRGDWNVEADFVASIREGAPVELTDFATGARYMRFTEAAWRAWGGEAALRNLPPSPSSTN